MPISPLPDTQWSAVLHHYTGLDGLQVEQRPIPRPGAGQVLIKLAASPINPSDTLFIEGRYGFKKALPVVPGFEGAGTVVAAGSGMMPRSYLGRNVACAVQAEGDGMWSQYVLVPAMQVFPLPASISLEQGSSALINPLTTLAMLEYAKQHGYSAFIHTAAASAIGGMLLRLSKARGIEMIHIVRRAEQIAALKSQGATYVLNSTDPHFDTALAELCKRLNVRLAFDAVGGDLTNRLVHAMPRKSKVRVYGALSGDEIRVQIPDLLFQEKSVEGFWLSDWIRTQNLIKLLWASRQALGMLGGTLKTEIRARYPLQKIHDALQDYQHQMTGGKVLITPNAE